MEFVFGKNKESLELQRRYREGKIKLEELSEDQIRELCDLYDKQIRELRLSNEYRKKKLLQYREEMLKRASA